MIDIGLGHYLTLGAVIFSIGIIGIFLNRKNIIVILMSIELILNAANINFIAFSRYSGMDFSGHIFSLFVIILAAAEAAVALAIILNIFNNFGSINIDDAEILCIKLVISFMGLLSMKSITLITCHQIEFNFHIIVFYQCLGKCYEIINNFILLEFYIFRLVLPK